MLDGITMKNMPETLRPYEKIEKYGAEYLNDAELLAVIIKSGTPSKTAIEIATEVIIKFGSLYEVSTAGLRDLMSVNGIGRVKAIQIKALHEIGTRTARCVCREKVRITDYDDIAKMFMPKMASLDKEVIKALLFDKKWQIIKDTDVSVGILDQSLVHPREIYKEAIKNSASAIILVHNHPSGDCKPSRDDLDVTLRIMNAGMIVGIQLADHIIIGSGQYYSMFKEGNIDELSKQLNNSI